MIKSFLSILLMIVSTSSLFGRVNGEERLLGSPDGRIKISIHVPAPESDKPIKWSAEFSHQLILSNCILGLQIAGEGDVLKNIRIVRERRRSVDKTVPVLFGKSAT